MDSQYYINPQELALRLQAIKDKKVCILGATGQVGRRILSILSFNDFPYENITLVSREIKKISYNTNKVLETVELGKADLSDFDIVFSCVPANVIREHISSIWNDRCIIIDKSSAFRGEKDIPLIVPEVNGNLIAGKKLICSPNCVAIPLAMTLDAILPKLENVSHVSVSTYQSVSGAGNEAMSALLDETQRTFLYNPKVNPQYFERQIAFNVIPKIGEFDPVYSSDEENKVIEETNRLLGRDLPITATCVRVPVMIGHSIALHIACDFKDIHALEAALEEYNGIKYIEEGRYFCPLESANEDYVYVSRLRRTKSGLAVWIVTDNLHKGAALNAIQIAILANQ